MEATVFSLRCDFSADMFGNELSQVRNKKSARSFASY
jgi:hypothetical protein